MTRNPFFQQRRRLRKVVEYIGHAVANAEPPSAFTLPRLAEIACWSPEHLDRAYRRARGETPLATVRRLRLQRAGRALREGRPLADVADEAGYASTQAFGRAFRREFGAPPLLWLETASVLAPDPAFTVVRLPDAVPCHALELRGRPEEVSLLFDEMVMRLQRSGSPRPQWQVFGVTQPGEAIGRWQRAAGQVELAAVALAPPLSRAPRGLAGWHLQAGDYARIPVEGAQQAPWDDLLRDAGWVRTDGHVLRHYDTDPAYTAPQERREWLYLPVARRTA